MKRNRRVYEAPGGLSPPKSWEGLQHGYHEFYQLNPTKAAYAWVITEDVLGDEPRAVGTVGLRDSFMTDPKAIVALGRPFRLKDDDGEIYYYGSMVVKDDPDGGSEADFAPLDDFGGPNAGCTAIEYKTATGQWEPL